MKIQIIASGSTGNCYAISDGESTILLDCGIPYKQIQKALNYKVSSVSGTLITHEHGDHCSAAEHLIKASVDVYASAGTISEMGIKGHRVHSLLPLTPTVIGSFSVYPFPVEHDTAEPFGFFLTSTATKETLLYFTDTMYLQYKFPKINYIIGECNYDDLTMKESIENGITDKHLAPRIKRSHMSLKTFVGFLNANDLSHIKQIYLCHLSNDRSSAETIESEVKAVTGAEIYIC